MDETVDVDERAAGNVVGVQRRLVDVEDGRDARRQPFGGVEPFRQCAAAHGVGEDLLHLRRPLRAVVLVRQVVGQFQQREEVGVEVRFHGADSQPLAVRGLVGVVVGRTAVDDVRAAFAPHPGLREPEERRREECGALHHRGVDHLPESRALPLEQRRQDAQREKHSSTAEVADQAERRGGRLALASDQRQGTAQRHVVDVVADVLSEWAVLPETGHAAVDQPGVALRAVVRSDAEPFGDPGAEALDQDVGVRDEREHHRGAVGMLEVDGE